MESVQEFRDIGQALFYIQQLFGFVTITILGSGWSSAVSGILLMCYSSTKAVGHRNSDQRENTIAIP